MAYESGSSRFCQRCGSHVGTLPQCPRCRAHQNAPGGPAQPGGGDWEPARLRHRPPAWRRPSVLISLAVAGLALALTWWIVAGQGSAPAESGGAGPGKAPLLASASPETGPETGPETSPETDPQTGPTDGPADGEPTETGSAGQSPGPSDQEPAAQPVARRQAEQLEELLSSSSSSRASLSDAIASATRCEQDGVRGIKEITASRRDQLAAAKALSVSALPAGTELKDSLVDALDASHAADAAFLSWARRHVGGNCAGPVASDGDYQLGLVKSETAQKAKTRFSRAWRPIAETYDLTAWKPDQI